MVEDENKNKWIGTYLNGLSYYSYKTNQFKSIQIKNEEGQIATDVRSLYIDEKNRIWAGTNLGIFVFSNFDKQIAFFPNNSNGLSGSIAEVFIEDENKLLWIGMYQGGICSFNESKVLKTQISRLTNYQSLMIKWKIVSCMELLISMAVYIYLTHTPN